MMQPHELKMARERLEWSQAELGWALGLSPADIEMMESGEMPIEKRTALALLYLVFIDDAGNAGPPAIN